MLYTKKEVNDMEVELKPITIRELVNGYIDTGEHGVSGYGGKLDIRPPYQREFVYSDAQQAEVIRSVRRDLPLNVMYWAKVDGEDRYELLDGQQRTLSICQYVDGRYSVDNMYFHNLKDDEKDQILDYPLMIYVCSGTDSEKLEWFKIINIAGEQLTKQELLNAVYSGPFVTAIKRDFSRPGAGAYTIGGDYLKGSAIRQDYLETALKWASDKEDTTIEGYMAARQFQPTGTALWSYFRSVIEWVEGLFPKYRKEMKGLDWGILYNRHGDRDDLDPVELEKEISQLIADEDVTRTSGVYEYVLTGNEKLLNIRAFSPRDKSYAYEQQDGKCAICEEEFDFKDMHADHIVAWSKGGKTIPENCQMLCRDCNLKKSNH